MLLGLALFSVFLTPAPVKAQKAYNNAIVGEPRIQCLERMILAKISTKEPFRGRVFVKGMSERPECSLEYASKEDNSTEMDIPLKFNQCRTARTRTLSPNGVSYANTIIIQFHKTFITKVDKAFNIKCFYAENPRTVGYDFDVEQITPQPVADQMSMPECAYTIRMKSPHGPIVRNANVGDTVFHRWECRGDDDMYAMLVHTCYVESLKGDMFKIIDENGCATDSYLLPDLIYKADLSLAYQQAQVFKYPDNSIVHFKCQIRLCTKMTNECKLMTPPACPGSTRSTARHLTKRSVHFTRPSIDVMTDDIQVFEETLAYDQPDDPLPSKSVPPQVPSEALVCANRTALVLVGVVILMVFVAGSVFVFFILARSRKQ